MNVSIFLDYIYTHTKIGSQCKRLQWLDQSYDHHGQSPVHKKDQLRGLVVVWRLCCVVVWQSTSWWLKLGQSLAWVQYPLTVRFLFSLITSNMSLPQLESLAQILNSQFYGALTQWQLTLVILSSNNCNTGNTVKVHGSGRELILQGFPCCSRSL